MKSVTRWTDTKLTRAQRDTLAQILKIGPDDSLMDQAERAIAEANRRCSPPGNSTNLTELKENLNSLSSALKRIQRTLRHMDTAHILDDHYCLANDGDTSLMQIRQTHQADSGFAVVASNMLAAVESFQEESVVPTGKGRHADTRFTHALLALADYFEAAFPNHKLSHHKRSAFANFAGWYLEQHDPGADPQRHISTALKARRA